MGDTAGGDHQCRGALADLGEQGGVGAAQRPVPGHVGDDVARAPCGVEPLEGLPQVSALLGPAAGRQGGAAHVEADGDLLPMLGDDPFSPLRVLQRRRAQIDPRGSGGQGAGQ